MPCIKKVSTLPTIANVHYNSSYKFDLNNEIFIDVYGLLIVFIQLYLHMSIDRMDKFFFVRILVFDIVYLYVLARFWWTIATFYDRSMYNAQIKNLIS